jgi:hypothetical protein
MARIAPSKSSFLMAWPKPKILARLDGLRPSECTLQIGPEKGLRNWGAGILVLLSRFSSIRIMLVARLYAGDQILAILTV